MDFRCVHCQEYFEAFQSIIEHCIAIHSEEKLQFRCVSLNPNTGKKSYLRKCFPVIPKQISERGEKILVTENQKIKLVRHDEDDITDNTGAEEVTQTNKQESDLEREDQDGYLYEHVEKLKGLMPRVATKLHSLGFLQTIIAFFEMLVSGTFPTNNISFLLFLDVVRFLQKSTSSAMTYSDNVKVFWRTGFKLFHGKFLRFMSGPKNQGQIVNGEAEKGYLNHLKAKINFAVPSENHLQSDILLKKDIEPGILDDCLQSIALNTTQIKVSFDGKRINSSLSERHGDVNLFGCESLPTFAEPESRKCEEIQTLNKVLERVELGDLQTSDIQLALGLVSTRIKELREMTCLKMEGLRKLQRLGEPDWKTSKYAYVISHLQSSLFEIKETIKASLDVTDRLCKMSADSKGSGHLYCSGLTAAVNLGNQPNYICIREGGNSVHGNSTDSADIDRHVLKQRSPAWFSIRRSAKVTGSTAHRALSLDTFKQQVSYYDEVFCGKQPEEHSEVTKQRMQNGTVNEIHAMSTLVGKVLPAFYPDLKFVEEGCIALKNGDENLLVVSPDGSGRVDALSEAVLAFEFKCPSEDKKFIPQVHYKIPVYYVVQLLAELSALKCSSLLFLSYTPESATVFKVSYDGQLWTQIWEEMCAVYGDNRKRPSRLRQKSAELKKTIRKFSEDNVLFLCEIPSAKGYHCLCKHADDDSKPSFGTHEPHQDKTFPEVPPNVDGERETLVKAQQCVVNAHNLCRKRATELLVFMASDLDRVAGHGCAQALPIAYGLQGPSINTETAKKMLQLVLHACDEKGLESLAFSTDGQWVNLMTRDFEGKPLTLLQHQKTCWVEIRKMPKQKLQKYFEDLHLKTDIIGEESQVVGHIGVEGRLKYVNDIRREREGKSSECIQPISAVSLKGRHLKILSQKEKKQTDNCHTKDATENIYDAADILPSHVVGKVDEETYRDILQAVQTLAEQTKTSSLNVKLVDPPHQEDTETSEAIKLDDNVLNSMLSALQSEECLSQKWHTMSEEDLSQILTAPESIEKKMKKNELKICVKTVKQLFPQESRTIRLSSAKWELTRDLLTLLGLETPDRLSKRNMSCLTLKNLALKQARRLPKELLCALYAEIHYPELEEKWRESFAYSRKASVNSAEELTWYSYPATRLTASGTTLPLLGVSDSHHVLTNLRTKCCSTGIPQSGIQRDAWVKIAKKAPENNIGLTVAHVEDLIDKQNNAFARLTFSEQVELEMRNNNDHKEADFCHLVRDWYSADDDPGIGSHERLQMRLRFRSWLMSKYCPFQFPPPSSYIGGIPVVTFECLMTNIERKIQMYSFVRGNAYNQRTLTTLDSENFFSVLGDIAQGGSGLAIRPSEIPGALRTACELAVLQTKSDRGFYMCPTRAPVYPKMEAIAGTSEETTVAAGHRVNTDGSFDDMSEVTIRNHAFDDGSRRRTKGKRKPSNISGPNQPSRGAQGVRQFHRTDESKILQHIRLGIELE